MKEDSEKTFEAELAKEINKVDDPLEDLYKRNIELEQQLAKETNRANHLEKQVEILVLRAVEVSRQSLEWTWACLECPAEVPGCGDKCGETLKNWSASESCRPKSET